MGGCAASKMPNGEKTADSPRKNVKNVKNAKFGFSSSTSAAGPPRLPSLNASDHRIKHLAVADDTYGIVQGGKPVANNGNGNGGDGDGGSGSGSAALDVMRDVGSQTLVQTAPDIKVSRPSQFPAFSPKLGSSRLTAAPLATMETASELGTPTPMEENKAFVRPYGTSLLPQPGQQRPLPLYGSTPARFAFSPAGQSFPSPSPLSVTPAVSLPSEQLPKPRAIRPPTSLTAPRPVGGATDNVMVSTASMGSFGGVRGPPSLSSSGFVKPTLAASSVKNAAAPTSSVESVRTASSASSSQKVPTEPIPNGYGLPQRPTDARVRQSMGDGALLRKPSIPKPGDGGLRQPQSSGIPARGPLATGHPTIKPAALLPLYVPPKPVRKSPQAQSSAVLPQSQPVFEEESTSSGSSSTHLGTSERVLRTDAPPVLPRKSSLSSSRLTQEGPTKFSSDEFDNRSDTTEKGDDESIFSEREGLAEMPKVYKLSEATLDSMLVSLRQVKTMANDLQQLHITTDKVLLSGQSAEGSASTHLKQNGAHSVATLMQDKLDLILQHPDEKTLNDPAACLKLILELQKAVRILSDAQS